MKQQFKQAVFMPIDAAQGITSLFVGQCRASTQMKKTGLAVTRFICTKSSSQMSSLPLISTPSSGEES